MRIFSRNVSRLNAILFSFESFLLFGILYGGSCLRYLYQNGAEAFWSFDAPRAALKALVIVVVCQASMYLNELYDYKITRARREFTIRLLQSLGVACILLSILYSLWPDVGIGLTTFLMALPTIILALFLWRHLYPHVLKSEAFAERVVVLGDAPSAGKVLKEIEERKDSGFEVVMRVTENGPERVRQEGAAFVPETLSLTEFPRRAETLVTDRVIVAIADRRGKMPFRTLLNCRFRGIRVEEAASFYESLTGKILLDEVRPSWFIFSEGFRKTTFTLQVKRITDILMAGILLVLSSPIMLFASILIKLDSKGPVIYKQDRVGEGWKDYTLFKFRSMVDNAEAMGIQWAEEEDPRVTRVGKIIRRYRIDELPQLLNVLKGDMSFVGPRPERRFFVEDLAREIPYYPYRLFVKPGITGWAQIKYHYGASRNETMEKLQYDLYYIKQMSFLFDLSIMFDTIRVVLSGRGAR